MENINHPRRDSKNLQAPVQTTIPHRNLERKTHKFYSLENANKVLISLLGLIVLLSIVVLIFLSDVHFRRVSSIIIEDVPELDLYVSAFISNEQEEEQYILTTNCTYNCSCLLYTNRKPFTNTEYDTFWSIVEDNKNTNFKVIEINVEQNLSSDDMELVHEYNEKEEFIHSEKEVHNRDEDIPHNEDLPEKFSNRQRTYLSGSHFYQYYISCAQRSSDKLSPLNNSSTFSNKKVFSSINTYPYPLYFTYSIYEIIEKSTYLHTLEFDNESQSTNRLINKYTSYIIPKFYKELLDLKVKRTSNHPIDELNIEDEEEFTIAGLIDTKISTNSKHPSMIILSAFIPRSLNVECRTTKQTKTNNDFFNNLDKGMNFIEPSNEIKYNNSITRFADNFNDLNGASTVRFEIRIIGLSPGKHNIFCLVSKIDETLNENEIQSKRTLPILAYKSEIEIDNNTNMSNIDDENYTYRKLAGWFNRTGYLNLYIIFDFVYLETYIKNNRKDIKFNNFNFNYLLSLFSNNDDKYSNKKDDKTLGVKNLEIQTLKQIKSFIKNIINGNFFAKKDLDSVNQAWSDFLSNSRLELDDLKHFQLKVFNLLDLTSNLTTLSIVPIDILSNNSFEYYKLWGALKQTIIKLMCKESLLFNDNITELKEIILGQLKLYFIIQKTALNGKRQIIVENCLNEINKTMENLFRCDTIKDNNIFKKCNENKTDFDGLLNRYKDKLKNKTVNEVLEIDTSNSDV